jgi:hypothetical protein
MTPSSIGQIISHEGKLYQILSLNKGLIFAHSYGDDCGIEETIMFSSLTGKPVATKSSYKRKI